MQIFNQLRWMTDSRAPVTVPEEEGSYRPGVATSGAAAPGASALSYALPRYDGTPPMLERVPRDPQTRGVLDGPPDALRERLLAQFAESGQPGIAGWPTTSNIWLVGRDHARDARAILLNGPQFGWWNPAYIYGIGLHGAGFDVVGNTPFAYPSVLFGHNAHVVTAADVVRREAGRRARATSTTASGNAWRNAELILEGGEPVLMDVSTA